MRAHLLLAALLAVPVAPAEAVAPMYVATVNSLYVAGDVKVVQGGTLTLVNLDDIAHDVISSDVVDGQPAFQSAIAYGRGDTRVVARVETLDVGWHPFYCSLHEYMRGTIEVVAPPA